MTTNMDRDARTRALLATAIVLLSLVGIGLACAAALYFSPEQNRPEMARLVFASVMPLLGTWVGTVLAFYFARENLQAATESTARLLTRAQPQPGTPVREAMIPMSRIVAYGLAVGADMRAVPLAELYKKMADAGFARIPILASSGAVLYVLHKATIDSFAGSLQPAKDPLALTETTGDLLNRPDLAKLVEAIAIVGPNAVVEDARTAMRSVEGCNDVFVTTSGKRDDPVIGWLTNTDLAGMA
jgi:hypothetical protein